MYFLLALLWVNISGLAPHLGPEFAAQPLGSLSQPQLWLGRGFSPLESPTNSTAAHCLPQRSQLAEIPAKTVSP
jgi:hypothetical protein